MLITVRATKTFSKIKFRALMMAMNHLLLSLPVAIFLTKKEK